MRWNRFSLPALVIRPTAGDAMLEFGFLKRGVFVTLKNSARNWSRFPSLTWKFLCTPLCSPRCNGAFLDATDHL